MSHPMTSSGIPGIPPIPRIDITHDVIGSSGSVIPSRAGLQLSQRTHYQHIIASYPNANTVALTSRTMSSSSRMRLSLLTLSAPPPTRLVLTTLPTRPPLPLPLRASPFGPRTQWGQPLQPRHRMGLAPSAPEFKGVSLNKRQSKYSKHALVRPPFFSLHGTR
jgi:hypothetical protein